MMKVQAFVNEKKELQYTDYSEIDEKDIQMIQENRECQVYQDRGAILLIPVQGMNQWTQQHPESSFPLYNHL